MIQAAADGREECQAMMRAGKLRSAGRAKAVEGLIGLGLLMGAVFCPGLNAWAQSGTGAALPEIDVLGAPRAAPPDAAAPSTVSDLADAQRAYDTAFQQMLKNPDDFGASFHFAQLATELGNYEPAISALERLLLVNPDVPQIKFELGVLYYLIDSYDVARTYLSEARASPGVPAEVRARADAFLAELNKRVAEK